jgi:hypothetical protein
MSCIDVLPVDPVDRPVLVWISRAVVQKAARTLIKTIEKEQ